MGYKREALNREVQALQSEYKIALGSNTESKNREELNLCNRFLCSSY